MAEAIIDAISSGFSLLPKIGGMFVKGFQATFMNATVTGDVTSYSGINDFGVFVLVFTGIAICSGVLWFVNRLFRARA